MVPLPGPGEGGPVYPGGGFSSFRVVNLAYNSGPMDVLMSGGRVVYSDLRYKEAAGTKFKI